MMADEKEKPIFVAQSRRAEIDGNHYEIGDQTDLKGLTAAQIGHVVGRGYYGVLNPEALTKTQKDAIEKEQG
jgi:hypothetical protein